MARRLAVRDLSIRELGGGEGLYRLPLMAGGDAKPLRRYFENKTSNLTQAFAF